MRTMTLLATIALLSACSDKAPPPAAAPAPAPPPVVSASSTALSAQGVGKLRFGMKLGEAEQAAGAKAELPTPFDPACSMVRFPTMPTLRFMVENDVLTRADADAGIENALGVAVGDTLEQVRAAHPGVAVAPHKYDANGHYLSFPSADGRAAIVLEESGGKITKIRAGLQPAVAYVETCG